jgi:NAD(P)H-dependent flavin oxidoreductase YrpB (nitropropane dioxygenase family)
MLALSWVEPEQARQAIRETRRLTARPFGVNLVLEWNQQRRFAVCLEENVPIVSFAWGDPTSYISAAHKAGVKVIHSVASAAEARQIADLGVDAAVAQGWESGGHVLGEVTTMTLLPRVVDAVAPLPVIAAGGIADGRGVAAALALGAAGVWIGTRFLVSDEAFTHPKYREAVLRARETDTRYTTAFDGGWPNAPHRVIANSTVDTWLSGGSPATGNKPGEGDVVAHFADGRPVHLYDDTIPLPGMTGEVERLALYAGQSVGLASKVEPASVIVRTLAEEAHVAIYRLNDIINSD